MKEKFEAISKRLSDLGINHQSEFPPENGLMQQAAYIDHLNHTAYAAIEAQYSQFNPAASKEEQILFFKKILAIKNVLRVIQVIHNDLTKDLNENSDLYIHNEEEISLNEKYILPELKGKMPTEIVRASFYQLLDNISKNNSLRQQEFNYISSLLMQLASRPEGIKLIVKLNYLLTTKDAQLILKTSNNFECSMAAKGFAKISPEYTRKSITPDHDFKTIFRRETVRGEGVQRVSVGVDYRYNDKITSLDVEVYASPGRGVTDAGPPFILLAHELIHGMHNLTGKARHNFGPFFQGPKYTDDPLMQSLYPTNSLYSYGPAAEEYWTIEGGTLCENSLRKEHGFLSRTGHVSAEAGCQAFRDLYYLGLARSYAASDLKALENHLHNAEEQEEPSEEDTIIERLLQLEKFNSMTYSFTELIALSRGISNYQLKKVGKIIELLKNSTDNPQDKEIILHDFLMVAPPKIAQLLVAVSKSIAVDYDEEIDLEILQKTVPEIQKLDEILKTSDLPDPLIKAFSQFTDSVQTKYPNTLSFPI